MASNTTAVNTQAGVSAIGDRTIVILGIVAGLFLVSSAAPLAPELINGILLLILVGTILGNADKWLPWFNQFSTAGSKAVRK